MPDPQRLTVSATQAAGLWNVSPYVTRWMLYKHFADGMPIDGAADSRMTWGKKLQPLVLEQAASDLKFEIRPNDADTYVRRGKLGCTRDAEIICPDRGLGAIECKCTFDYATWMRDWSGGKAVPRHYEIQLQQQMYVGDGVLPYRWGVIAAWVGGEQFYFERAPIKELWDMLDDESTKFFDDVKERREPQPFGAPAELPWLTKFFPPVEGKEIRIEDEKARAIVLEFVHAREQEAGGKRVVTQLRPKILALLGNAERAVLGDGIIVTARQRSTPEHMRKASTSTTLDIFVPETAGATAGGTTDAG